MTGGEPIVVCRGVGLHYAAAEALRGVDLQIDRGEFVGVIGPNGGGKSSLVRLLVGLETPTSGSIELFGRPARQFDQRYRIGYLPQRVATETVAFPLSVRETVLLGRVARRGIWHRYTREDRDAADAAMAMCDVADLGERLIGELSGGQRQRVFLARALAATPDLLILDEPSTGVDVASLERFYAFLHTLHREGMTIVLVTHDIGVISEHIQKLVCINGTVDFAGEPQCFLDHPHLDALYGHGMHCVDHRHGGCGCSAC